MRHHRLAALLLLALVAVFCPRPALADEFDFTIDVAAGKIDCFYQTIDDPKYAAFEFDYQVVYGGDMDISVTVKSPTGHLLVTDFRRTDGDKRITLSDANAGRGDYAFCFDNSFSSMQSKMVFFEFFLLDAKGEYLDGFDRDINPSASLAQATMRMEDFAQTTIRVKSQLNRVEHLQSILRAVEFRDRSIMEANYDRVNFWSMVHIGVMLFTVAVQIFLVRSLFEERSTVGRLMRKGKLAD